MRRSVFRKMGCGLFSVLLGLCAHSGNTHASTENAYDFEFKTIGGEPLPLERFKSQTVLVVNTASQCGFTKQYEGLQHIWKQYRDRGFVVLGIPSNDFGGQEPGSEAEIRQFCSVNFNVDFPLTSKVTVKGSNAHPFYRWAAAEFGPAASPRWNFHKYLIAPDGQIVDWFSTATPPASKRVRSAIERHLPERKLKDG